MKKILTVCTLYMLTLTACSNAEYANNTDTTQSIEMTETTTEQTMDFSTQFSDLKNKEWIEIGSDGKWMTIDTNPYNSSYYTSSQSYDVLEQIKSINEELGFGGYVYEKMKSTRALDGTLSELSDKYEVSWKYHPDNGLEVIYRIK